jgi:hypothetical protein
MFDALHPEAAEAALAAKARRPAEPQDVGALQGFWRALKDAPLRAGAEMGRAMTSLVTPEAAGAVDAPTMFSAPKKPAADTAAELRAQDAALRDAIRETTPDPNSTGAASMVLHEVTRFVSMAAGYSALGGTPAAIAGMTLDEGINEAQRRMDEGVDAATAARLGVTKGIASGVAVALPVAGKGWLETLGLATVGGPGSFVMEQTIAKNILNMADYEKQAADINPFDPLGLGISFLGPLGFGAAAHAVRGVRAKGAAAAVDAPPQEVVDAAQVATLQAQREASMLSQDPAALAPHAAALDRATEQLGAGERVMVDAPVDPPQLSGKAAEFLAAFRETEPASPTSAVEKTIIPFEPAPTFEARLAQINEQMPDLQVQLEGMEAPVPVRQLLDDIKAAADQEVADSKLLKVAAECALRG